MDNSNASHQRSPFWSLRGRGSRHPPANSHPTITHPPAGPSLLSPTPIHSRSLPINAQRDSPLYNGRIPPEIRDLIFIYALTEYTKTDAASQFPKSTNYTRPGYTGKKALTIGLLQACRRVYMETYHLPPVMREHVFWHGRHPEELRFDRYAGDERHYFRKMKAWQVELVREVHVFAQMVWLEGRLTTLFRRDLPTGVEKFKITVRRGDWWWNERNEPLGICPQNGSAQNGEMRREWEREKRGEIIPWKKEAWGSAFVELLNLKELEIEFETSEDKVSELKAIVEKAKGWKFPMKDGTVLSAENLETKTMEWRGGEYYWSQLCPYCSSYSADCWKNERSATEKCKEKERLKKQGLGPMCTVMSVRWRLAKDAGQR